MFCLPFLLAGRAYWGGNQYIPAHVYYHVTMVGKKALPTLHFVCSIRYEGKHMQLYGAQFFLNKVFIGKDHESITIICCYAFDLVRYN